MTGTTVGSRTLDFNPALTAAANSKRGAAKTQDFGDVLNKTAQKLEQPKYEQSDNKTAADLKDTEQVHEPEDSKEIKSSQKREDIKETPQEEVSAKEISEDREPADEMTAEEIADALSQIIEQIKEILGISDEELLSGMEDIGMQPLDLLDSANMAQLVTAIAGEDSSISLVANEELYTALQDISEMVNTQVNSLLEDTGLTGEELEAVLEKLKELENQNLSGQMQEMEQEAGIALPKNQDQPVSEKETVIIKEQTEELPENQQENPTEGDAKVQVQKQQGNDNSDSKSFGQQNLSQNFQNELSDAINASGEGIEKFTSESTENIMRQLADMVKIVKGENLTEMELQLHPASLGTVNVSLTTKGGIVTAEFTTQNEAVKAAIEAQASQLRANLEEQGVRIEAIEVSVASHQMERNLEGDNHQGQQQSQEQQAEHIQGVRRGNINLKAFESGDELMEEMQGADDATRIAMEIMTANGNTMDLMA
ncbi:MAG: flagellar hook-length control protein FliK [Lachnospiraceae bacterium]|nr:flagellar hook-length control protein FliK [Lachnospiraceae bacterium]